MEAEPAFGRARFFPYRQSSPFSSLGGPAETSAQAAKMSQEILMQFVGFTSGVLAREYTFMVREVSIKPREFTVTIANEAFSEHRLSFQDAPDVCSLKLRRELTNGANLLPESHFCVTNAELDDYRTSHESARRIPFARRTANKP